MAHVDAPRDLWTIIIVGHRLKDTNLFLFRWKEQITTNLGSSFLEINVNHSQSGKLLLVPTLLGVYLETRCLHTASQIKI